MLVLATLGTIGVLGVVLLCGLNAFAAWAERDLDAYPFMQEDWLRYLLPTRFVEDNDRKILLTGPSTVRENLLHERFEAEFPDQVIIQGGISLGTIVDATAALNYIEAAYGAAALPSTVVLGISPRFIANIPAERPLRDGIDRYSPCCAAHQDATGITLSPKGPVSALKSRVRFLLNKAPDRYRTALFALATRLLAGDAASRHDGGKSAAQETADRLFRKPAVRKLLSENSFGRTLEFDFTEVLAWLASPYKYRLDPPADVNGLVKWMDGEDSWWRDVHAWNPQQTSQATRASLARFNAVILAHDIALYVVNMPERDVSRVRYDRDNYAAYLALVRDGLPNAHFLDLQEFLHTDEFHDLEHSRYPGSLRLTDRIIAYMKSHD